MSSYHGKWASNGQPQHHGDKNQKKIIILICILAVLLVLLIALIFLLPKTQKPAEDESLMQTELTTGAEDTDPPETEALPETAGTETTAEAETEETEPPTEEETVETTPEGLTLVSKPVATTPVTPTVPKATQPTPTETSPIEEEISSGDITCDAFGKFSGQYVEDGRDEPVENVAAVLVTNQSDQFLDLATITIEISGETATFVVTGLPAGRSAWVLEANRMTIGDSASFEYLGCVTSFRDGVSATSDQVKIYADGNMLTAKNVSSETLENVFVYYRTLHTDGNFLGGITYRVDFGTLEPDSSVETMAGHFEYGKSEIVRIGWQTG